jgi:hypothetical protein
VEKFGQTYVAITLEAWDLLAAAYLKANEDGNAPTPEGNHADTTPGTSDVEAPQIPAVPKEDSDLTTTRYPSDYFSGGSARLKEGEE